MSETDIRTFLDEAAAGRLTRRQLLLRGAALGLSVPLLNALGAGSLSAQEASPVAAPAGDVRGPAVSKLIYGAYNVDQAPLNIRNGDMDLYLAPLKAAGVNDLQANPAGIRLVVAPASTDSLILNPAPGREGELNPFSIREIRQAMHYLIDRDFLANDIFQGRAVPMPSHVSPSAYDELTVFNVVHGRNIRYEPEYAKQLITEQMQAAGAVLQNGLWFFNNAPVVLKIVIRTEDERRDIGDFVSTALGGVGFQVQPIYQQFGPATLAVYNSDPISFQWHAYTEGWGRGTPDRYDYSTINAMAAPWLGNMPGWRQTGFWQYENEELDRIGQRLFRGEFQTKEERDELYRQMTGLALDESVRIWLVTGLVAFPLRPELQDVNEDIVSGPATTLTLREARAEGRDEIKVGHLWVWTERTTFNPVGGFGDVYSINLWRNMTDPPILNHPHTSMPIPFRAAFAVETAGPTGTLPIPEDAVGWDAVGHVWQPVGAGVTAVSKVTYDYAKYYQSTWHHGPQIDPADMIYSIAQGFDLAYDEQKLQIETALGITQRPYLETFKGFRLLPDNRIEVYVNYWHFEPSYIASYATPSGMGTPWELLAAMDTLVFEKRTAAYSDAAAARFSVPWLSLVQESDARLVIRQLREFGRENAVPAGVFEIAGRSLVAPEQAAARYQAAIDWFERTNLLLISNGPFFLVNYDPSAQYAEMHAFREPNYPFKPGDFRFGPAPRLTVQAPPPPPSALGQPISFPLTVAGPGTLSVQFVLVDPSQAVIVTSGVATDAGGGNFTVAIPPEATASLFPGFYQLYLLASSDQISQVAEQRFDLEIVA